MPVGVEAESSAGKTSGKASEKASGVEVGKKRKKRGFIYQDIPESLRSLIEPVVDEHDCELVDVEVAQDRGTGLLRITVDSREGDGRVSIDRCAGISREVETLLDGAEAMPGAYRLEVSSPGLDRVLGREKDFAAVIGKEVKLRTRRPIEGRKRFRGRLLSLALVLHFRQRIHGRWRLIFSETPRLTTMI